MTKAKICEVYTLKSEVEDHEEPPTVVVLKAQDQDAYLPIYITVPQGQSIAVQIRGQKQERPRTYGLMAELVDKAGGTIEAVHITEMRDSVYYASILLTANGDTQTIDSRPSDALALAAQVNADICIAPELLWDVASPEATMSHRKDKSIELFTL
jgi:bifunctional DNase/RNase